MIFGRFLSVTLAAVGLTGCMAYPIHKITQPESQMIVLDEGGRPIEGATVTLLSNFHPHPLTPTPQIKTTNIEGKAAFPEEREWQVETMMIHGARAYFWNWCVQKPGFKTFATGGKNEPFKERAEITLVKGLSTDCP